MIRLATESDIPFIISCANDDDLYDVCGGDGSIYMTEELARNLMDIWHIFILTSFGLNTGFFMIHPHSRVMYEAHFAVLKEFRGTGETVPGCLQAFDWMFKNTKCKKIISNIPIFNERAYKFTKKLGMKEEGLLTKSFDKDGLLYDMHLMCISGR